MITIKLDRATDRVLWEEYADKNYSNAIYTGFRGFVAHTVPEAKVTGTTASGVTLVFEDDMDFVAFKLKWLST